MHVSPWENYRRRKGGENLVPHSRKERERERVEKGGRRKGNRSGKFRLCVRCGFGVPPFFFFFFPLFFVTDDEDSGVEITKWELRPE